MVSKLKIIGHLVVFIHSDIMTTPIIYEPGHKNSSKIIKKRIAVGVGAGLLITGVTLAIVLPLVLRKKKSTFSANPSLPFQVTNNNNIFAFYRQNVIPYTVQIPVGTYSAQSLAATLQSELMTATSDPSWSVAWDSTTGNFSISCDAIKWDRCDDPNSIYGLMGLEVIDNGCGTTWKNIEKGATVYGSTQI